jgi:hypothetical protein
LSSSSPIALINTPSEGAILDTDFDGLDKKMSLMAEDSGAAMMVMNEKIKESAPVSSDGRVAATRGVEKEESSSSSPSSSSSTIDPVLQGMQDDVIRSLLDHYCDQGDVQMCSTIALVLGSTATRRMFPEQQIQQWHNAYVEQLMSLRLFVIASDVMSNAGGQISEWNRKETTVYTACKRCGNKVINLNGIAASKPEELDQLGVFEGATAASKREDEQQMEVASTLITHDQRGICDRCQRYTNCVLCEMPVHGPFVWRSKCGHGGHMSCMELWSNTDTEHHSVGCPAGCDCYIV